jgi:hypothetical protein
MASVIKNIGGKPQKLTRGVAGTGPAGAQPSPLGTITAAGDVVAFTVPEPSRDHQGNLVIQVGPGTLVLGPGTFALEFSLDAGASWAVFPTASTTGVEFVYGLTGQPGADTAAVFAAQYNVSGFGAGAVFRFGFVTGPTSGSAPVFALVG